MMKLKFRLVLAAIGFPAILFLILHIRSTDFSHSANEIDESDGTINMYGKLIWKKEMSNNFIAQLSKKKLIQIHEDMVNPYIGAFPVPKKKSTCTSTPVQPITADITSYDISEKMNYTLHKHPKVGQYWVHFPPEKPKMTGKSKSDKGLEMLTVIILPHSHNDPGWLVTKDEYYISKTHHILTRAVEKLTEYEDMTFIFAESSFLYQWWMNQRGKDEMIEKAQKLLNNGQLEIVTGGWVMPDEASTHYYAIIDQLVEGHRWLYDTFKFKPRSNWAVDPFGHSGTVPYLWKLAGFDFMVTGRVHQAVKDYLAHHKQLEFNWRQFWDPDGKYDMVCHTLPGLSYTTVDNCGPDPKVCKQFDFYDARPINESVSDDDPDFVAKATALYEQFRKKAVAYKYNTLFMPTGADFRWARSYEWEFHYKSFTRLFKYMNSRPDWKIKAKFGTLRDYYKVFNKSHKEKVMESQSEGRLPVFSGDFFPYSEKLHQYWTGYFTTRPRNKFFGREVEAALRTADILMFLACTRMRTVDNPLYYDLCVTRNIRLRRARHCLGVFLHHDAITGTAVARVVKDYEKTLLEAFEIIHRTTKVAIQFLLAVSASMSDALVINVAPIKKQPLAMATSEIPKALVCTHDGDNNNIVLFNPLPFHRQEVISVRVGTSKISVSKAGKLVTAQILPVFDNQSEASEEVFDLMFVANVPPMGFEIFEFATGSAETTQVSDIFVSKPQSPLMHSGVFKAERSIHADDFYVENSCLKLTFSGKTGLLKKLFDKISDKETLVEVDFVKYKSHESGAYIFGPKGEAESLIDTVPSETTVISGSLVTSVHLAYHYFQHTMRLYHTAGTQCRAIHVENLATVGKAENFELAMRFKSDLISNVKFFTDGNGLQMVERVRRKDGRIEANYYPMTTMAVLQDSTRRFTLHSFQPLGVSSLRDGWLETMLDRTMPTDDGRGMGEGVINNPPAPSSFYLTLEQINGEESRIPSSPSRQYMYPTLNSFEINDILQNPLTVLALKPSDGKSYRRSSRGIVANLPCGFHIVSMRRLNPEPDETFEQTTGTTLIVHRRPYQCSTGQHTQCAPDWTQFSLQNLFVNRTPTAISEWTLSYLDKLRNIAVGDKIKLKPMDIKSFYLKWF